MASGSQAAETVDLLSVCEDLCLSFNPAITTPDVHLQTYLEDRQPTEDENDIIFLRQVLYGCVRYSKFLDVVLDGYFVKHREGLRRDRTLYAVLSYLCLLRLSELSVRELRNLCRGQNRAKLCSFMGFLFEPENVEEIFLPGWSLLYDPSFNQRVVSEIEKHRSDVLSYLDDIREKPVGYFPNQNSSPLQSSKARREPTVPEPFRLTQPRPRLIQEPDPIPVTFKAAPLPATLYEPEFGAHVDDALRDFKEGRAAAPSTLSSDVLEENRRKIQSKYAEGPQPFDLQSLKRPTNLQRIAEEVEAERAAAFEPVIGRVKSPGEVRKGMETAQQKSQVRLNAAAILREDALYKKKQEQEAAMLRAYEYDLRDATEFLNWQNQVRGRDEQLKQIAAERRRLEMALADQEAREAKLRQLEENRAEVQRMKQIGAAEMERLREELEQITLINRLKAEELNERTRAALDQAKQTMKGEKEQRARELRDERTMNEIRVAEMLEAERQRKEELIRQIRAMENVPSIKNAGLNVFDPTISSGIGLLSEMSLAELKERLMTLKKRFAEEEEEKRGEILATKQQKEQELVNKVQNIQQFREAARRDNATRRDKMEKEKAAIVASRDQEEVRRNLELAERLAQKRAARRAEQDRVAAETRARLQQQQFLALDAGQREERKFEALEQASERVVLKSQSLKQEAEAQEFLIQTRSEKTRIAAKKAEVDAKAGFIRDYDSRMSRQAQETAVLREADSDKRKTMFQNQKTFERTLKDKMEKTAAGSFTARNRTASATRGARPISSSSALQ